MVWLSRLSRRAVDLKTLHRRCARTLPFQSAFSESKPPPVVVKLANNLGRAVFASQNISSGEVLHSATPMVVHPSLSMINSVCYNCLRRLPKRHTSDEAAHTASFCSQRCQQQSKKFYDVEKQADWSRFHEYCRQQGLKYPLIAKRLACQIISRKIRHDFFEILCKESLSTNQISLMKEEFSLLSSTLKDVDIKVENYQQEDSVNEGEVEEPLSFLTEEWYTDTLARIRVNAFRVELPIQSYEDLLSSAAASVEGSAAVGNAMYMLPSFYNHSCDPNVNIVWTNNADGKMVALRDIEEGEELRICYIDASMGYEARRKFLYQGYGFLCDCPGCAEAAQPEKLRGEGMQ